jgi:hypothetical protein
MKRHSAKILVTLDNYSGLLLGTRSASRTASPESDLWNRLGDNTESSCRSINCSTYPRRASSATVDSLYLPPRSQLM